MVAFLFVNFVEFQIKEGKEEQFKEWFKKSNAVFSKSDGFISRTLLVSEKGTYAAIVMHRSRDTFMKMRNSKDGAELRLKESSIFEGKPNTHFYETVEL